MSKQTALQQLIEWGNQMIGDHPAKTLSFYEAIDKAEELLEVEKEQIMDAFGVGCQVESTRLIGYQGMAERYYNETYGGDK
jgi:sulfur transfer protein SufE